MAFKTNKKPQSFSRDPAAHIKTLTKRQIPDVMPHQKVMLESYAGGYLHQSDVALQLPTGSGKTLVGLLIADWRRIKFHDRAVYLCPTRQLVHQTVLQAQNEYGIDVVDLSGPKSKFPPADSAAYMTGDKVAVTTYSALFNTNPFFRDPDLIIIDDAHAAENYIAKMWSMNIVSGTPLHSVLSEFLKRHLDSRDYSRLTGDWSGPEDSAWVEKIPSPKVGQLASELGPIIDAHATIDQPELYFTWSVLRDYLDACHIYLGSREILIRPLIPPTAMHPPFSMAKQRIFMSATLGAGGDLERLTGRKSIERLPAPEGFQNAGVGRRYFIFPSLSLADGEVDSLRLGMQQLARRSVILTPSTDQADEHEEQINSILQGYTVFTKDDIEENKAPFVTSKKAVAILANRYDGIDFPGDECRLLILDGLPKAMNIQERFVMSKMGALALYNERIQTRILQAAGRCTRALQDRSAVFVTGTELVDFLADDRKWQHFHPELQAELSFGVEQSNTSSEDILENFEMFMKNDDGWSAADGIIRDDIPNKERIEFPAMDELEAVVRDEITYQEAMWNEDYATALSSARRVLTGLTHPGLRGYRALWHYLAGSAAFLLSTAAGDSYSVASQSHFSEAKSAAPSVSWLNTLAKAIGDMDIDEESGQSAETLKQVEAIEQQFLAMGTATNHKFEKRAARLQSELDEPKTFESAHRELGELLGFNTGNGNGDAAPDPWWLGDKLGVVFEDHAGGQETTPFGAEKARQASGHPKWLKQNVPGVDEMEIIVILVTPCSKVKSGAVPQLDGVHYWALDEFRAWTRHAIGILRELKGAFPDEGDLVWRAEAGQRLEDGGITLETILRDRPRATDVMEVVK